ncbi:hypothetical protein [Streptomyces zaehneri]|uniref:hypothetical protein n=1 Tax=Streptomyces zaehneri TaxID=3051180 RepID=UPI0028D7AF58|nr:hypothetical protein [Streptomyces sp. DSM 40713]
MTTTPATPPATAHADSADGDEGVPVPSEQAIERVAQVPAPGGSAGPIAFRDVGSGGGASAPPAPGLPRVTTSGTAGPMPASPKTPRKAGVAAPTAKTTSVRSPRQVARGH